MEKLFYLLVFFSFGTWNTFAQDPDLFQEGNEAYANGNYELAIEKYDQILENGKTAAAVHYNLANAHYKLNHIAPSIYHYEKALQLEPNDEDIQNNLAFAQNMAVDAIEVSPKTGFSKWWSDITNTFSVSGWAWASIIFMVLFVILFLGYYFSNKSLRKRLFFTSGIFFLVLAVASVYLGFSKKELMESQNYAIVFAEEVEIRSEPNERSSEVFVLHEGAKVEVLEDFQGWAKIQIANGNQGWVSLEMMKKL